MAGAKLGTQMLWLAIFTWPLMGFVQMMCARIGMVTEKGLASPLKMKFPKCVVVVFTFTLFVANTIIGADLAAMADAGEMLSGINSRWFVAIIAALITWATIQFRYQQIAAILKWLALSMFTYVFTAFVVKPDWKAILADTFIPHWPQGKDGWSMLVAILGTTISLYLFFWQTSLEVEEKKSSGRTSSKPKKEEVMNRRIDVGARTFASNLVMYFIILVVALTLNKAGQKDIEPPSRRRRP